MGRCSSQKWLSKCRSKSVPSISRNTLSMALRSGNLLALGCMPGIIWSPPSSQGFPVSSADQSLLAPLLDIARSASVEIMRIYATDFDVATKEDKSPVTEADLAAHKIIVADLKRITPDLPVLSEESADIPYAERRRWGSYWLVDPLDGTKEFISKNGDFTVNIALIQDGEPVVGVVHVPATGLSYYGCVGVGAFRRDKDGQASAIHVRKLLPGKPVKVVSSRSHRGELLDGYLAKLGPHETVSRG